MTKTFYTSNYETNGTNPKAVAISEPSLVPASYEGVRNADLAPTKELLNEYHDQKITHEEYSKHYTSLLTARGLTPEKIAESFEDGTTFLCFDYEDGDPSVCHRVILAEWLTEAGVAVVTEI